VLPLASQSELMMRKDFWIGRGPAAMTPAFMLSRMGPVTVGERAALLIDPRAAGTG
jgi:hypothetical protein